MLNDGGLINQTILHASQALISIMIDGRFDSICALLFIIVAGTRKDRAKKVLHLKFVLETSVDRKRIIIIIYVSLKYFFISP